MKWCKPLLASVALAGVLFAAQAQADESQELAVMANFIDVMNGYLEIIEQTHDLASEPDKAAILQMQKLKELYEERGEKARVVDVLRQVLEESNHPAVRNAATQLLSDTLKEIGRSDQAAEILLQGIRENVAAANR